MGYYSDLAMDRKIEILDHSYTPPEKQLLWRLKDLEDRLAVLTRRKTGKRDAGEYFSEDDLRYVLPEHFLSASNVRKAIDLAVNDLQDRYGIYVGDQPAQEEPEVDEVTDMQISIFDFTHCNTQACKGNDVRPPVSGWPF